MIRYLLFQLSYPQWSCSHLPASSRLLVALIKCLMRSNLRVDGFFFGSLFREIKTIMPRKAWQQELEVSSHIASAIRKQRTDKQIGSGSGYKTSHVSPPLLTQWPTSSSCLPPPKAPQPSRIAALWALRDISHSDHICLVHGTASSSSC